MLALMLAGCVAPTTAPWGLDLGDYQAEARDLVGVTSFAANHVIRLGHGGAISEAERDKLAAFLAEIAYNRPESLRIVVHGRANSAQERAIAGALLADGVDPEHVLWARDARMPAPAVPRGTVVLAAERAVAVPPACPGTMFHPSAPVDNLSEPNFGCANVHNFAAMIADPHHLYQGASSIYYLGQRGAADVTAYRTDKVKPLPKINEGFTVAAVVAVAVAAGNSAELEVASGIATPQQGRANAMRCPGKLSAILLVAGFLAGCAPVGGPEKPAATLDRGAVTRVANVVKQSGEYDAAARIEASYAAAHPNDAAAQVSAGESALQAGETDRAVENFYRAAQLAPGRADAHYGLARAYLARNQPSEAVAEFQAVLTAEPKNVRALNGMGIALDLLDRGREAQSAYRAALAIAPDDRAARNNLGLSLVLSGDYDQAVAQLSTLARQPGATARTRQNLALALGLKGDETDAAQIASGDLDPASIAGNQRFFAAVRRLAIPGTAAIQNNGSAAGAVVPN